jgi:hypothetical protein
LRVKGVGVGYKVIGGLGLKVKGLGFRVEIFRDEDLGPRI